ncbi:phage tail terminator family protein [Clostridium lundense]|uniref:phage tail terminator family protein n=1 Tax=Clostridium lundense TaxID=319475 RepID=UPI00048971B4|nr:hypothetical protein [Clostridium lundense]
MKELLTTISKKIYDEFQYPACIEDLNEGIIRPSFFIYIISNTQEDRNRWTYEDRTLIQIVYFSSLDSNNNPKKLEQINVIEKLKKLFSTLFIKVGDEIINILGMDVDYTKDKDIFLQLSLSKIGFREDEWNRIYKNVDKMKEINIRESEV